MIQADSTIAPEAASLTRARLARFPRRRLRTGRNVTKAEVDLVELETGPVVIKDLAQRPWPVRLLLGPWQLDREERAYRRLAGTDGIPRLLGRPDRQSIVIEYIRSRSLNEFQPGELDGRFFDRLERLVREVHRRGIAHGDLHHRDILAAPAGDPYLVDFATSVAVSPDTDPFLDLVFHQMCGSDLHAVARLRRRLAPDSAGPVPPPPLLYRLGSRLKKILSTSSRHRPD